jgi:multidrug resistance efflux pump
MWKEKCAKADRKIQGAASELQTVKKHLDFATIVVKRVKELLRKGLVL